MVNQHIYQPGSCQVERIRALADSCDNEYYLSALLANLGGNLERAKRGRARIEGWILEFEALQSEVECPACREEIDHQLMLQRKAIQEIDNQWSKQT